MSRMPTAPLALAALTLAAVWAPGSGSAVTSAAAPIAVARDGAGIELIDATGKRLSVLTRHAGWADSDPAWSPDGMRLAFTRSKDGLRSFQVYVMRANGSGARRITRGRFDWRPQWSSDGRWIAYQATSGIRRVHPDGSGDRRVPTPDAMAAWPSWAPGGRISYSWHPEVSEDLPAACRKAGSRCGWVLTSRPNGSDRRPLVRGRDAHWSPDGRTVVFTQPDGGVATVPATGGAIRDLGKGFEADWSPDGRQIVFARMGTTPARDSTWVMNRDGSGRRRIARGLAMPAWRPR